MRGTIWTVFAAAIGAGVMLSGGVSSAVPASAANSTSAANSVLSQTAPFVGLVLMLAALGALVSLTMD